MNRKWLEEVKVTYRTDPFTAVIANLISAGAKNGAEAKTLPSDVKAELITNYSEQRVRHAGRQLYRFMVNADGALQFGDRIVVTKGRRLRLRLFEEYRFSLCCPLLPPFAPPPFTSPAGGPRDTA